MLLMIEKGIKSRKCRKLVCNLYDKHNYAAHRRTLKTSIKSWTDNKKMCIK